jgi:imidazolonepropionase-like amidohydrolase
MDTTEIGGSQPDLRAASSVNLSSAHLGVTRSNGVTRAETAPRGAGPVRGQSALLDLAGDTWDGLVQLDPALLHVAFPELPNVVEGELEEPEELAQLRRLFARAREYGELADAARETGAPGPARDPRLAALAPYARGAGRVALHAANAQTILAALRFAREAQLDAVLFGALEGWKVADELAAAGLPVVVGPVLALPRSRYDPCEAPYANAAVLLRAGVEVAIQSADDENPRNLPFHAAMAAAHGLPPLEALRAITLTPARILGVEDELGSLEPGKIADLVVTEGDLLETTSPVRRVFIDGRPVDMQDRQRRLYRESVERLERLRAAAGPR